MSVDIRNLNYAPTLSIRPADMRGLEELPPQVKDRIQPIFLFAPWPNARTIERTTERLKQAFGERPFFLDIDRYYEPSPQLLCTEVGSFWQNLRNPSDNYKCWRKFIKEQPNASPCIQFNDEVTQINIRHQVIFFQKLKRNFAVRFELVDQFKPHPKTVSIIVNTLREIGTADYVTIIDGGWTQDSQSMQRDILQFIQTHLSELNPAIPIILSYTTIPKDYTDIQGISEKKFDNRTAVDEVRRAINRSNIIYGDWGSTKPRQYGRGQQPSPRIDVALKNSWLIARNSQENWNYQNAAENIIQNPNWKRLQDIHLWGIQSVKKTAENPDSVIHSAQSNVAARVNMHLFQQALYNQSITMPDFEEDWED